MFSPRSRKPDPMDEYRIVYTVIDNFDARSLTIKSWSVTLSAVGIGAALKEGAPLLALLAAASALVFWIIDAMWKGFQHIAVERAEVLEATIRAGSPYRGPGLASHYKAAFKEAGQGRRASKAFIRPSTFLPHGLVVLGALAAAATIAWSDVWAITSNLIKSI